MSGFIINIKHTANTVVKIALVAARSILDVFMLASLIFVGVYATTLLAEKQYLFLSFHTFKDFVIIYEWCLVCGFLIVLARYLGLYRNQ